MSGCATSDAYKKCPFTPSGAGYTYGRDRETGNGIDFFGLTWSLK